MAKIPFYEDRLTPQGFGVTPQARAVGSDESIGKAMQSFGNAGVGVASAMLNKENADAIANATPGLAEAVGFWPNRLNELARSSRDGGVVDDDDGKPVTLTTKVRSEFEKFTKDFLGGIQNGRAKQYAQEQLTSIWATTYKTSLATEAQLGIDNRGIKIDESVASLAKAAAADHTLADANILAAKTAIANAGFDEKSRNTRALAAQKTIAEAALTGAIQRNAPEVAQAIKDKYGVTNTEAPNPVAANLPAESTAAISDAAKRLGISAANLTAIISYETGGKFDPSIRGGKNNKHIGLIQFGEEEQRTYGAHQKQTFAEQMVAVEKYLKDRGVQPGDDLKTLYKIVNGGNRNVSDNASDGNGTIAEHVAKIAKEHGGSAAPRVPVSPSVSGLVDKLEPERMHPFLTEANTQITKQQNTMRSQLVSTEGDHMTLFQNGQPVQKPLTEADYSAAFGPIEGPQRFANYQQAWQVGNDITTLKMTPLAEQEAIVMRHKPDPTKPGYELATKRFDAMVAARDKLNTERSADPIKWAQANGIGDAKTINWAQISQKPEDIATELSKRTGIATTMNQVYGAGFQLLSKDEASKLAAGFNNMTAEGKLSYLGLISKSVTNPDAQRAIINQIAPDSPMTALAGKLFLESKDVVVPGMFSDRAQYNPQQVATMIIKGEAILNPSKAERAENGKTKDLIMPKEQDMMTGFDNATRGMFKNQPNAAQYLYQAAKNYYAAASSQEGIYDGEFNSKRWETSIEAVSGGISSVNGSKVARPWGMPEDEFKNRLEQTFTATMAANGKTGRLAVFRDYEFENTAGGNYLIRNGSQYVTDANNKPILLSMAGVATPTQPREVAPTATPIARPNTQQQKTK